MPYLGDDFGYDPNPVELGELGAGLLIDPNLCDHGFPWAECPNGCAQPTD